VQVDRKTSEIGIHVLSPAHVACFFSGLSGRDLGQSIEAQYDRLCGLVHFSSAAFSEFTT
jgi:hypothetical protein